MTRSILRGRRRFRSHRRAGLSLLELIVTLAILVGGSALLAQLINVGRRHSERAVEVTEAQTAAHNVLSEILAGIRPWEETVTPTPVDFWSPWNVAVTMQPVGLGDMTVVTVLITERPEMDATGGAALMSQSTAAAANTFDSSIMNSRDLEARPAFKLTRWIRRSPPRSETSLGDEALSESTSSGEDRFGGGR